MSESLRDSAVNHYNEALSLMQKDQTKEALIELEKAEEAAQKAKANDVYLLSLTSKGQVMQILGKYKEAFKILALTLQATEKYLITYSNSQFYQSIFQKNLDSIITLGNLFFDIKYFLQAQGCYDLYLLISKKLPEIYHENVSDQSFEGDNLIKLGNLLSDAQCFEYAKQSYEKALEIKEELLVKDPKNLSEYQSNIAMTLYNLGNLLWDMGYFNEAKQSYERSLETYERILKTDPENPEYQSDVALALNDLGALLWHMGLIVEAKPRYEKALELRKGILKTDPENVTYQSDVGTTLNNLGSLFRDIGLNEEAGVRYEKALEIRQKLFKINPGSVEYQSYVGGTLNNLGNLLFDMGRIDESKMRYEKALEIYEKLLQTDPDNVCYQSDTAMTLNNLGSLLKSMEHTEEAKQKYKRALEIFTEPMQYLTIGTKSNSIIKLIELNTEQAKKEDDPINQMIYLREILKLCRDNQEFLTNYELKNERKLVIEAGLSTYIEYLKKSVRLEPDLRKKTKKYERALQSIEKLNLNKDDETVLRLFSSAVCYLKGRKLVNEALASRKPELELLRQAVEQFKSAKETYDEANVCFCIHTGLLNILEKVECFEQIDVTNLKELVNEVVKTLSEDVSTSIRVSFESIPQIFEERNTVTRKELLKELSETIDEIEYKALEKLFGHVHEKIKDYFEKPFNLNVIYDRWKLKVIFHDTEKIKGELTIKAGDRILLERVLSKEEIEKKWLEIDYLDLGYLPQGEDVISFTTVGQRKPVFETVNYFEKIIKGHDIRILQHDCSDQIHIGKEPKIAAVQLKYHIYKEDSVVKISIGDNYYKKIMTILENLKDEADIIVFPEFSIPFDYLGEIQKFADENKILVIAGSHYVTENNLGSYGSLFLREFTEADLMKNISPTIIPLSTIVHNEKCLGARIERPVFSEEGMEPGKINHIFKLQENLHIGVMICYEFLNTEIRHRLTPVCNIILVPQTNDNPQSFYETASLDINRPVGGGNTAFVMSNGIFTIEDGKNVHGGSSGIVLTLDKHSNALKEKGIIFPVDGAMEQFILIATINTEFFTSWDGQIGQVPITTRLIHIFEESEILKDPKRNGKEFIKFLKEINCCDNRIELRELLEKNRGDMKQKEDEVKDKGKSLIEQYSPLMNNNIQDLKNLDFEKIKKKCSYILVPAS